MLTQQEKMVFCTLFDSNYLDKGLALYYSMRRHMEVFKLYIYAFDSQCHKVLSEMHLKNTIILSVNDIMNVFLRQIQAERTRAEFCWTCTPLVIEHVLLKFQEKICTYIDADIYFYASPEEGIQEILDSGCSVGLVEHRFKRDYEYGRHIFRVGRYCIQFNTFLNNKKGMQVLNDWKGKCLEWCYYRYEDGRLGDQKYPDKWKQKYSDIYETQNIGLGVAPWNVHLYACAERKNDEIWMNYKGKPFKVIFFHFEGMKYLSNDRVYLNLWGYNASGMWKKVGLLYGEYFNEIKFSRKILAETFGITFRHMLFDKEDFCGKRHSLRQFCEENGLVDGSKKYMAYRLNNIAKVD